MTAPSRSKKPVAKRVSRALPAPPPPPPRSPFVIVGVGASAGGLEAFLELLGNLPADTGMAFVLVQHLAPDHESALGQLLAPATKMPILEVTDQLRVEPNHVYVIPPGKQMTIIEGVLHLQPRMSRARPLAIDRFFQALAHDVREQAVGIILSGTATDGTLGLEAIKAEGGITFAQDASARFESMPRSAVAAGCADFELAPKAMAQELARMARHPLIAPPPRSGRAGQGLRKPTGLAAGTNGAARPDSLVTDEGFRQVLARLLKHRGVDFSAYKPATLLRRVARRMILSRQESTAAYAEFLDGNNGELDALYADMLISVTGFFRNPEAFSVLQRKVFRRLLNERTEAPVRAWVLGCSTGQEAYTLAMAFAEEARRVKRPRRLQIFASDLNETLLEKARTGFFPANIAAELSPERLRRFFVPEQGGFRANKNLRESIVFARQNVLSDPPFSRLDLISCRNVLIYIEAAMQRRILPLFHFALNPGGVLFLGASESVAGFAELYGVIDAKHRIFSRKSVTSTVRRLPVASVWQPADRAAAPPSARALAPPAAVLPEIRAQREADRLASSQFAPPGVLVDTAFQIVQFRGPTDDFLAPSPGRPNFDLLAMVREGLMLPLRAALRLAQKHGRTVRKDLRRLDAHGRPRQLRLHVVPVLQGAERCFLVLFDQQPLAAGPDAHSREPGTAASRRDRELKAENLELRERLRQTRESGQSATEELQASNEEVTSSNEELQSINEELETSKEELESTNEELTTVNEELGHRNSELGRLNVDLRNFHASINTPILFVDGQLVVRRLTPQADRAFNVLPTDVGRPLGSIRHSLIAWPAPAMAGTAVTVDLERMVREVIAQGAGRDCEVMDREGHWLSLRVRPYLTAEGQVDGAVLVLVDIDALKRSEAKTRTARDYAEAALRTMRDPLVVLHADLRVNTANDAFYRMFQTTAAETCGRQLHETGNRSWDVTRLQTLLREVLAERRPFNDFELPIEVPRLGRRTMQLNGRRLQLHSGGPELILLAMEDVTDRRDTLATIVRSSEGAIIGMDLDGIITNWNREAELMFGYNAAEAIGRPLAMLVPADRTGEARTAGERIRRGDFIQRMETVRLRRDRTEIAVTLTSSPITDVTGRIIGSSEVIHDVSEAKRAEDWLRQNKDMLAMELAATQQLQVVSSLLIGGERDDVLNQRIVDAGVAILRADGGRLELYDQHADATRTLARHGLAEEAASLPLFPDVPEGMQWQDVATTVRHLLVPDLALGEATDATTIAGQYRRAGIGAAQSTPLLSRDGRLLGIFSTYWHGAHTPEEGAFRLFDILARQAADLIERRVTTAALQLSESKYRALFDSIDEGFAVITMRFDADDRPVDYRFDEVNPGFAVQTGIRHAKGRWVREINPQQEEHWFEIHGRVARTGEPVRFLKEARGLGRWFDVFAFRPPGLEPDQIAVLFTDVTASREASLELERVRDEAVAASRAKDDFLATLSHELRTPLTPALLLAAEAAANDRLSEEVRKDFESIRNNIGLEARLIDDLLDLTRVSRGKLKLDLQGCDIHEVLRDAVAVVRGDLEAKGISLTLKNVTEPTGIKADPVRLQQAFWNVLRNAIHFTPRGGKIVAESVVDATERTVSVHITDSGVGIAEDELERIFEAFAQGEGANEGPSRRFGGLGLGLAISRKLMEAQGGAITARSAGRGEGSTFTIRMPLAETAGNGNGTVGEKPDWVPVPPEKTTPAARLSILAVDDHPATCEALARLLNRRGYGVTVAGSVEEALAILQHTACDVLLSDIGLPDGDGFELMRRVRASYPHMLGIAVSGYGSDSDVTKSQLAGFSAHLTKPIGIAALEKLLADHQPEVVPGT